MAAEPRHGCWIIRHAVRGVRALRQDQTRQRRREARILTVLMGCHDVRCRTRRRTVLLWSLRTAVALSFSATAHAGSPTRDDERPATSSRRNSAGQPRSHPPGCLPGQLPLGSAHLEYVRTRWWCAGLCNVPPRSANTDLVYFPNALRQIQDG